ncbi:tRNA CCA-pyrophosphorylase [Buchnera aphidicola (Schlechtendalia chinensis)]|uniref:CCA-adding enzyme n=1 Tax=Buchnera aphidicola subsp. Schlechtendalia chinensis TaxID=118110 RepID=A0A172WD37_BUCSC|nr:tRNA CCA-pyrophosphorylase [Buchnera aphidicola]ANF16875.1 tRNA CCA-pyrophosphorylase [Buchnera aphidicola (Schlechtendalia chinensis)]
MKIYLVGGAVRDELLNVPIKDRDWVVIGATPKMLLNLNFRKVGKDFPVFLHPISKEEYSLARIERKCGFGYTGFKTNYCKTVTLKEDLKRRDLTINAIAKDKNGNYIDFFNGLEDLRNRTFRHVSLAFCEDPLRIFRVARFSAAFNHFGFRIASETMKLMINMANSKELLYLTKDRIWKETEKAFNTSNPHVYFQILYNCNVLYIIFPEINLVYQNQFFNINKTFQAVYFKFNFSMEVAKVSKLSNELDIKFAYICGIICYFKIFNIDFFSLEVQINYSKELVEKFCNRLCVPSKIKNLSVIFSKYFKFLSVIHLQSSKNIVVFLNNVDAWRKPDRIYKLSTLIDLYMLCFMNVNISNVFQGTFLKNVFEVSQNISTKCIINSGFSGIEVRFELTRLRIIKIDRWRNLYHNLKVTQK